MSASEADQVPYEPDCARACDDLRPLWLRLFLSDGISGRVPAPFGHRTVDEFDLD